MNLAIIIGAILGFLVLCYIILICVMTRLLDRHPEKFVSGLDYRKGL
jgi:phage shock protein PspC (stress-responsive transcriptional regulator)